MNFEDERLSVQGSELGALMDAWYARHPDVVGEAHWLYLDEVQNVPGWERFVRRLLDRGDVRVLLTGSSSKLLSAEIATSLRGRALASEVLPFSFGEALSCRTQASRCPRPGRLAHAFGNTSSPAASPRCRASTRRCGGASCRSTSMSPCCAT